MHTSLRYDADDADATGDRYHGKCKTERFAQGSGSATLYKLDSLNERMGGINDCAALVSFQPLSDAEKLHAKELYIAVMGPEQLRQLDQH